MSTDPLTQALDLLTRGHRLYTGPPGELRPLTTPEAARLPAARAGGDGLPGQRIAALADTLRRAAATDTALGMLLAQAHTDRTLGHRATKAILDDAHADRMPAADTPLGHREALRRMAARLHAQRRHIRRSRRTAQRLTGGLARLDYPHVRAHRGGRPRRAAQPIGVPAVHYAKLFASGRVTGRIADALDHLGITAARSRRNWLRGYRTLIARESGGHPSAIAAEPATAAGPTQPDGHPLGYARGLTQTLPATFARYHQPGTSTNIYDPVANICASINYVRHRYGVYADGSNLAALVAQADPRRGPKGY